MTRLEFDWAFLVAHFDARHEFERHLVSSSEWPRVDRFDFLLAWIGGSEL